MKPRDHESNRAVFAPARTRLSIFSSRVATTIRRLKLWDSGKVTGVLFRRSIRVESQELKTPNETEHHPRVSKDLRTEAETGEEV